MTGNEKRDWQHALVTGASAGIGAAYLRQLAPRCDQVTAVARRGDRLAALREALSAHCEVHVLEADLACTEGQARVMEHIRQHTPCDLLVNNAGFSTFGPFASSDLDSELAMIRLHQEATLALTRTALPAMLEHGRGAVINVASMGGFLALPGVTTYAATKAFLVSFSRSLQAEVAKQGVTVQCLCPGYTRTEIHSRESFQGFDVSGIPEDQWMDAEPVVQESLAALAEGRLIVVPGDDNRALLRRAQSALVDSLG